MSYSPLSSGVPPLSRSSARVATNPNASSIPKGRPIRLTPTGITTIDVSNEIEANSIAGITRTIINGYGQGEIVTAGLLEDIGAIGIVGDVFYVDKSGGLTNIKPSIGINGFIAGDWVVRVGILASNNSNPVLFDLLVNISIVGAL